MVLEGSSESVVLWTLFCRMRATKLVIRGLDGTIPNHVAFEKIERKKEEKNGR